MDRRKFLGAGAATLAGLAIPRLAGAQCGAGTVNDNYGEGPFYTENAPRRIKIARDIEPGQRIIIGGEVKNCTQNLAGVNLDLWQATHGGCYKHPDDECADIPGHPESFRLRGQVATGADGRYEFETVKPGKYLNDGTYRPSHIHCIITIPGKSLKVTTQLYFRGDAHIPGDDGADHPNAANRIIPLAVKDLSPWTGTWDIILPGGTSGIDPVEDAAMAAFDVALQRRGGLLTFHIPSLRVREAVEMRLYDAAGTLLKRSLHRMTPIELDAAQFCRGAYVVELAWWTGKGKRKEAVPFRI